MEVIKNVKSLSSRYVNPNPKDFQVIFDSSFGKLSTKSHASLSLLAINGLLLCLVSEPNLKVG